MPVATKSGKDAASGYYRTSRAVALPQRRIIINRDHLYFSGLAPTNKLPERHKHGWRINQSED